MSDYNEKFKYWELWRNPENGNPKGDKCMATHWSDEWYNIQALIQKSDDEIREIISADIEFVRDVYGEKVTKRSIEPAFKEYKKILEKRGLIASIHNPSTAKYPG